MEEKRCCPLIKHLKLGSYCFPFFHGFEAYSEEGPSGPQTVRAGRIDKWFLAHSNPLYLRAQEELKWWPI